MQQGSPRRRGTNEHPHSSCTAHPFRGNDGGISAYLSYPALNTNAPAYTENRQPTQKTANVRQVDIRGVDIGTSM